VAPLPLAPMADPAAGYKPLEARREAQRCLQCECLECVKVCEYLAHYGRYPRKYVREVYNNLSIVQGTRTANRLINSCSLCGLCAEVCPTGLDMGAVNRQARRQMVAQGRMPPSAHDFALRDMAFSQSEHFALARNAPGAAASDYVFFPGCQLAGSAPDHVPQVLSYLAGALPAGTRLGLMLGCCGAPADWAGRADLAAEAWERLRQEHAALGRPRPILACSSCHQVFRQKLPDLDVVLLWDLMAERGLPARAMSGHGRTVSVHDPCTSRHEPGLHASVRRLLAALDYQVAELPRSRVRTTCCGFGGVQWLANPEVAQKVVARRVQEGPADYVTYCAMCRDVFARGGKRTFHLLDLIFGQRAEAGSLPLHPPERSEWGTEPPGNGGPGPTWSQRHENRARLKRQLLKEIWGETMEGQPAYESIKLIVSDEVRAKLEARLILDEDLQRVIEHAERTGRRLLKPADGHFVASYRPTAVTYWVEYAPEGDAFVIFNAYSHRMEIVEDEPPAGEAPSGAAGQ
jgi:Fe-S oxidoreductase